MKVAKQIGWQFNGILFAFISVFRYLPFKVPAH